jgi:hypothetical protein
MIKRMDLLKKVMDEISDVYVEESTIYQSVSSELAQMETKTLGLLLVMIQTSK